MDKGQWLLLAFVLVPVPLVFLVAILRSYNITIHFQREEKRR